MGDSNCPSFVPCLVSNGAFKFSRHGAKTLQSKVGSLYDCRIEDSRISIFISKSLTHFLEDCDVIQETEDVDSGGES